VIMSLESKKKKKKRETHEPPPAFFSSGYTNRTCWVFLLSNQK